MDAGDPPTSNSFIRSKNCPWMSPHTAGRTGTHEDRRYFYISDVICLFPYFLRAPTMYDIPGARAASWTLFITETTLHLVHCYIYLSVNVTFIYMSCSSASGRGLVYAGHTADPPQLCSPRSPREIMHDGIKRT